MTTNLATIIFPLLITTTLCSPPLIPITPDFETFEEVIPLHRLPNTIIPAHYTVELQPILDEGHGERFTSPGKVWINAACRLPTTNITLHALTINITESSVRVSEFPVEVPVPISSFTRDEEKEQFIINLEEPLRPGQVYRIYIEFVAPVSRKVLVGLYLSNYTDSNGETKYMTVTDLEATDARRVFPCFDEPQLKATFDISILRLPTYHTLSNMNILAEGESVPTLPGWVKDTYHRTEAMSTYLFCLAVSDFEFEEASAGNYGKPVKVWGPPPYMRAGAGKYSPDLTAKLMKSQEDYFQIEYSFPKMDKIAVPHFLSGAMENWGLNTYRLNRLLIEEGIATTADRVSAASTLSHELVHQWFGNLVTCEWWDDLWLNEGFASYYSNTAMMDIGLEEMLPLDTLVSDAVQRALQYDASSSTHPIHHSATTPTEIRVLFDTITYSKGAALVRMMESILTEPAMRTGLTAYLTEHSHSNAHQDDLFNTLNDHIPTSSPLPQDQTLKSIMDDWTLQSGFPVLRVTRTPGTAMMLFTQEKYRSEPEEELDPSAKWAIPISIQVSTEETPSTIPKTWLLKTEPIKFHPVATDIKWVVVNPRQTGYYRVSYNEASLREIIEQLHADHTVFDAQTRSALIDDNLNLAFAGYFQLSQALNLTMYLKNERHLVPWTSFVNNMAKPYRFLARTATANPFKKYILGLVKDTLTEIGLDPQPSEPIGNATILRNKLFEWACNLGDKECVDYSVQKFRDWMQDPMNNTIIFPDLRPYVYCTAVANEGEEEWNFAFSQYKSANREVTKLNLIRSLACTKSSYRLNKLLEMSIDINSGIDDEHRLTAIQSVIANSAGVDIAFNFIRNNFNTIVRRHGPQLVASVISSLGNSFTKQYDITDIEAFVSDNEAALEPVKDSIQSSLATIQSNVRWMQRNSRQFDNFLRGL